MAATKASSTNGGRNGATKRSGRSGGQPSLSGPRVEVPVVNVTVTLPPLELLAYYAALGAMAALEVIEWPVALVVGSGHLVAARARQRGLKELGEGLEAGA